MLKLVLALSAIAAATWTPSSLAMPHQDQEGVVGGDHEARAIVPDAFQLSDSVRDALAAEWLTPAERLSLRVFHGLASDAELTEPAWRAESRANAGRWNDAIFEGSDLAPTIRARARLLAGDAAGARAILGDSDAPEALLLRASAEEACGARNEAIATLRTIAEAVDPDSAESAALVTTAVEARFHLARLEGQPARDYSELIRDIARAHQELDRLYWPATLLEAEILVSKGQREPAVEALHATLRLMPRCANAWYLLGRVAAETFDWDGAARAEGALRRIHRRHPLADLLLADVRLRRDDPEQALEIVTALLQRYPHQRDALTLAAAAHGLMYDEDATAAALAAYDAAAPGDARAYAVLGHHLSRARQYDAATQALEEALRRAPQWTAPALDLGLLHMQAGRDGKALSVLRDLVERDPFDLRAGNSLRLLEDLAEYRETEMDHFIVRWKPGVDEALVAMMDQPLRDLHEKVTKRFQLQPAQKTVLEVMPDHERFSVRIAGIADIHTMAACTGPVIAMEVPREGRPALHRGVFDWVRVIRHEYTHTVTLEQTRNRIPHWLTEAAAVSMELAPRRYETCVMLAEALHENRLFDLDEIKWAFVRPRRPTDRAQAYAQSHWMLEYMNLTHGDEGVLRLLRQFFDGRRDDEAFVSALGVSRDEFYEGFTTWARREVEAWGLAARPTIDELLDRKRAQDPGAALELVASRQARLDAVAQALVRRIGQPRREEEPMLTADRWPELIRPEIAVDDPTLEAWRAEYPDHPDLLEAALRRRIETEGVHIRLIADLQRLAALRPVDTFAHRRLAQIHLAGAEPARAIAHLEELDIREESSAVYARQLADLYRRQGNHAKAYAKALRACWIDPYRAEYREFAAAIAIENKDLAAARMHIHALTILEPDRPQHQKRLERVKQLMAGQ